DNCIACLKDILSENLTHCFIEMSSCVGSCIGGPVMAKYHSYPVKSYQEVIRYAGREDFKADLISDSELVLSREAIILQSSKKMPTEEEIQEIFHRMGKNKPEDQLNCGSCGYNSCRDKAIAVFQGKADMTMCLPFLKEKAESLTSNIIGSTPNGIIVVNEQLEVQLINKAAREIMNIQNAGDVMGEQVIRILDPKPFMDVLSTGRNVKEKKMYLAEYDRYVEMSVVYDRNFHILMCLMRDVTSEENAKEEKAKISEETVMVADKVVDKQMRIVQEIASLLGETAAETKIALTKLKESIKNE
ncbi:MAG: (Fe-S)-binding protein, partial [Sphaerochaetaceae bacterium]|nr:(Fe-S)-binding protein [Sphaerochaetaceae bacterium]